VTFRSRQAAQPKAERNQLNQQKQRDDAAAGDWNHAGRALVKRFFQRFGGEFDDFVAGDR